MMPGADDPAAEIQHGVEVDDPKDVQPLHQAQLVKDRRDDHSDKELEEALDPKVDDPKTPRIDHGVVGGAAEKEGGQIEDRDRRSRDKEEVGELPAFGIAAHRRQGAP